MITWPFVIFILIFIAVIGGHFIFAYRSWWTSRGEPPSDIDPHYVRLEDYFGRSFRLKVSEWLNLPVEVYMPDGTTFIRKGAERIHISDELAYPSQTKSHDILVVRGPFRCGAGCVFSREIYVHEDAAIGPGSQVQSVAVDGNLTLGSNVHVARWVDSLGDMEIGPDCHVGARATAGRILRLQNGVQVKSAFARTICVSSNGSGIPAEMVKELNPKIEIPLPATDEGRSQAIPEVNLRELIKLSPECWLYRGDFKPSSSIRIKTKLIVKGDCVIPSGSVVENDLKAEGTIQVGAGSVCMGNVIADGDIWFGPSSRFHGIVHAGGTLRLSKEVRGGIEGKAAAAYAAGTVTVGDNVVVHGKLASGEQVEVAVGVRDSGSRKGIVDSPEVAYDHVLSR